MKRTDTKQAIINAAFSFYETPSATRFSLGEIAKKVGISKAAVFRHFKNKEDLILEMRHSLFSAIGEVDIYWKNGLDLEKVVGFCKGNKHYINYLLEEFLVSPDFELDFYKLMHIDETKVLDENNRLKPEKIRYYMTGVYALASFFFFIKNNNENISDRFWDFMQHGAKPYIKPENFLITDERLDELDSLCVLNKEDYPEEIKFVVALSKILKKEHIRNVTIEKIAKELGIAKSSLYSHFASKKDFFQDLLNTERDIFYKCLERNYKFMKKGSEFLYIQLVTTVNFLKMRASTISLFGWLRLKNDYIDDAKLGELKKLFGAFGSENSKLVELFSQFVVGIATTVLTKAYYHKFSEEELKDTIRLIFGYFMNGIAGMRIEDEKVWFWGE